MVGHLPAWSKWSGACYSAEREGGSEGGEEGKEGGRE